MHNNFHFMSPYIETVGQNQSAILRFFCVLGTELIVGKNIEDLIKSFQKDSVVWERKPTHMKKRKTILTACNCAIGVSKKWWERSKMDKGFKISTIGGDPFTWEELYMESGIYNVVSEAFGDQPPLWDIYRLLNGDRIVSEREGNNLFSSYYVFLI